MRRVRAEVSRRVAFRRLGQAAGAGPAALLAACGVGGTGGTDQEPRPALPQATLRMLFFHNQWTAAFDEVIRAFQSRNPQITVEFQAPPSNYIQAATVALAGGAGPDVMSVNWDLVRTWTQAGHLHDLTPEASRDKAFAKDLAAYHPKIQALMKWEGKQRAVGLDHDDIALFWNVSLFKQQQLPLLTTVHERWTWNDLLETARKLTKKGEHQYGLYAQNTTGQTGYWSFVFANGGQVLTDDGTKADPLLEPPAVEAIQWIADTALRHGVAPQPDDIRAAVGATSPVTLFTAGKLAMNVDGSWRVNAYADAIKDFEWDVAHLPLAPRTGKRASVLHGTGLGVNRAGKAVDAAVHFAKHLATRETHRVYGATGIIQSARVDEWDGFYASPKPPAHRNVLREAVEYAHQHPLTGQWGIITYDATDPLEAALDRVFSGAAPARDGLQEGVREFDRVLAEQVAKTKGAKS
jgi:ABC-type glycerol-3-phosphate transport system substrate-binding protein